MHNLTVTHIQQDGDQMSVKVHNGKVSKVSKSGGVLINRGGKDITTNAENIKMGDHLICINFEYPKKNKEKS